jgi:hypothetical protein
MGPLIPRQLPPNAAERTSSVQSSATGSLTEPVPRSPAESASHRRESRARHALEYGCVDWFMYSGGVCVGAAIK